MVPRPRARSVAACPVVALALVAGIPGMGGAVSLAAAAPPATTSTLHVAGLQGTAQVVRDADDVPHIYTTSDHDAAFMLGWVHAQDRFFQMDMLRRTFDGTLAELAGQAALPSDIQLRTLGLDRAAAESLPKYPASTVAWLEAYAAGVNAYLRSHPLPPEYTALQLTPASVPAWTPLDSLVVAKGLAFQLSFDLSDIDRTVALAAFQTAGQAAGFDGTALFYDDVDRQAPFNPTISIPGWLPATPAGARLAQLVPLAPILDPEAVRLAKAYRARAMQVPLLKDALRHSHSFTGSNWWVVSGALSQSGHPLLANDPHLSLSTPAVFYEVHMLSFPASGPGLDVSGVSFPGTPAVVLGCNARICWGATTNPMDVTDVYLEQLVIDPQSGLPVGTTFDGKPEPLVVIQQTFRYNQMLPGKTDAIAVAPVGPLAGGVTLVVPRRNNGPIVEVDTSQAPNVSGLSVQYTGWRDTREIDSLLTWQRAKNLDDFKRGPQYFHFGSQNWSYADVDGNIAYFTSGAQPLREDLEQLHRIDGTPPTLIRDGTHHFKNEWLPVSTPQPGQQLAYEILPFAEMPQVVNPAQGYVLTANNDPIGTTLDNVVFDHFRPDGGILYFGADYDSLRAGQIALKLGEFIADEGKLDAGDMTVIQHNNQLYDARYFVPIISAAVLHAVRPGAPAALAALTQDAEVLEAVDRLQSWGYTTPTGVLGGYDPGANPAALPYPTKQQVNESVAATVYTVWRSNFVKNVIDATLGAAGLGNYLPDDDHSLRALRQLLDTFPTAQGRGASGLPFFAAGLAPGVAAGLAPDDARDLLILASMQQALQQLASSAYGDAYGGSGYLPSYRYGKLHRIVFAHLLGGPFDIPGGGDFHDYSPSLPGISRCGGFDTIDAASFGVRVEGPADFMFDAGPARRFVGEMLPGAIAAQEIIPGGESGVLGSPHRADQLGRWLTNQYHPLLITSAQVRAASVSVTVLEP